MTNINWDGDAESAPFKSRFDDESENLILAETDTGTALFEWDGTTWQFRGPVEMNGEDVSGIESLTATSGNFDSVNTEDTHTKRTNAESHHYAAEYDGENADERLTNALEEASGGDVIHLENGANYETNLSFPQGSRIVGNSYRDFGARIDSGETWETSNTATQIEYLRIEGELSILNARCHVSNVSNGDITIDAENCLLSMLHDVSVTFESGTTGGMVGVRNDDTSITDNGDNKVLGQ